VLAGKALLVVLAWERGKKRWQEIEKEERKRKGKKERRREGGRG
jgi:hypothetical protein